MEQINDNFATQQYVWDDYKLSPEVLSMIPTKRKIQPNNYKLVLSDILEEKYK